MRRHRIWISALLALASPAQDAFGPAAAQALAARSGQGHFRVLQFGDSHTASRAFTAAWRSHLQAQFGDGGWGFGLPWASTAAPRCGKSAGWTLHQPTLKNGTDGFSGPGGAYLQAVRPGDLAWVEAPFRRLRVYLLRQPGGGRASIRVDGGEVMQVDLAGSNEALCIEPPIPKEARRLEVACLGGPVRILGVAFENGPGATYSALGTNGAQASWLLRSDPGLFESILRRERPDLVILAFGTNEASLRDFDPEAYRRGLASVVARIRAALPAAALVLLGPPDAHLPRARPGALDEVTRIQDATARSNGGLFVTLRASMGGADSIDTWSREGLALKDRVHFSAEGYLRLARAALEPTFARLASAKPAADGAEDARLAGAFMLPAQSPRMLGHFETIPVESAPASHPIYTFRTEEGRLFITDDPAKVEGMRGTWVGRGPGR